ncbi:cbb3-type cytochrome c oxidase subunit I [Ottowia sp.]|uniref:cbb3-type cytochrome c oxidase subunit I n=1 Tax=Ottowia sp. TaxID=1898956 RepID=UPI00394B4007
MNHPAQAIFDPHALYAPRTAEPAAYTLPQPTTAQRALARAWLALGLAALAGSGLYSVLLVLARTPGVNQWFPVADFFRVALVVHVDLSVLVWFAAMAGMLWSLNTTERGLGWSWAALGLCGSGTVLMALGAFIRPGEAIMANYIPVLHGPLFLAGLVVFGLGLGVQVLRSLLAAPRLGGVIDGERALRFGLSASVVCVAVALLAFAWSFAAVPTRMDLRTYYEILFWGGGHALQFAWTLLMLVVWLWLAHACGGRVLLSPRIALLLLMLALVSVFITPYAYVAYDAVSVENRQLHTWAMRVGGGLAIFPIALAVVLALAPLRRLRDEQRPLWGALVSSMLLFACGGVIGMLISGSNVKIPAHYHGCIVGVTLALMGIVYHLLPTLGWSAPRGRMAVWQPWLYGAGQLMHIIGLVWSGGYGVQRKVAGSEQVLRSTAEVAGMGLMGLGGLLAVIGGLLFVVVVLRAMRARSMEVPA